MTLPTLLLIAAYLIGGIPFGYLVVRMKTGKDVRSMGSGNIGATNVLRTTGRGFGVLTLLLDIVKGYAAVWLMDRYGQAGPTWVAASVVAVVIGHAYPVFLRFQGGKAVASFVGAALRVAPAALLVVLIIFVLVVAKSRFISLGSICGAAVFPFAVWLIYHPGWQIVSACLFCGLFVIWRHKSNIERLRAGTENVFRFGGKKS